MTMLLRALKLVMFVLILYARSKGLSKAVRTKCMSTPLEHLDVLFFNIIITTTDATIELVDTVQLLIIVVLIFFHLK